MARAAPPLPPFQALLDDHLPALAAYLRAMLPLDAVDDALQETLLAALRAYPGFDGANPRAWLLTIARRKAIDESRAAGRRPVRLAEPDEVVDGEWVDHGDGSDSPLWRAVAGLPARRRAAVVLRFAVDLRYREIGAAMGCSEAAARRSVHEAMKSLRESQGIEREVAG